MEGTPIPLPNKEVIDLEKDAHDLINWRTQMSTYLESFEAPGYLTILREKHKLLSLIEPHWKQFKGDRELLNDFIDIQLLLNIGPNQTSEMAYLQLRHAIEDVKLTFQRSMETGKANSAEEFKNIMLHLVDTGFSIFSKGRLDCWGDNCKKIYFEMLTTIKNVFKGISRKRKITLTCVICKDEDSFLEECYSFRCGHLCTCGICYRNPAMKQHLKTCLLCGHNQGSEKLQRIYLQPDDDA